MIFQGSGTAVDVYHRIKDSGGSIVWSAFGNGVIEDINDVGVLGTAYVAQAGAEPGLTRSDFDNSFIPISIMGDIAFDNVFAGSVAPVPEPAAGFLVVALVGLVTGRRR